MSRWTGFASTGRQLDIDMVSPDNFALLDWLGNGATFRLAT